MRFVNEFDIGESYLIETERKDSIFQIFRSLTEDRPGFCITSEDPDFIKKKYALKGIKFARISDSSDRKAIGPKELDLLGLTIKRFISEDEGIVFLDGIDYLVSKNDTSNVISLIRSIEDRINGENSAFLMLLDPSKIKEKDLKLLKDKLHSEVKKISDTSEQEKETDATEQGEHLVSQVRSMMEFLKEQEQYIEKEEDKIDLKEPSGISDYQEFEELKEEIETLRKENRELKNELEKVKKEEEGKKEKGFDEEIADEVLVTVKEEKKDIEEQMKKLEEEGQESEVRKGPTALMGTLRKLEDEVTSLREEVKTIKKESPEEAEQDVRQEEDIQEESEEEEFEVIETDGPSDIEEEEGSEIIETDRLSDMEEEEEESEVIESERPSEMEEEKESEVIESERPSEMEEEKESEVIESETPSDIEEEDEIIREPKLENEYLTEEKEVTGKAERDSIPEGKKQQSDEKITYDDDKMILTSDSRIHEDIESEGSIEVQKGVRLKGSLKSEEDIVISDNTTIKGEIISESGSVKVGKDCKITGEISGESISISERSKVEDINAKKDVILEKNTRVRNINSQEDVKIFENVEIDGDIDYGGQLDLDGEYINIRGRIRPIDQEVVEEKWA